MGVDSLHLIYTSLEMGQINGRMRKGMMFIGGVMVKTRRAKDGYLVFFSKMHPHEIMRIGGDGGANVSPLPSGSGLLFSVPLMMITCAFFSFCTQASYVM